MLQKHCACRAIMSRGHTKCCTGHAKWSSSSSSKNATPLRNWAWALRPQNAGYMVRIPCACHIKRNPLNDARLPTFWQRPRNTALAGHSQLVGLVKIYSNPTLLRFALGCSRLAECPSLGLPAAVAMALRAVQSDDDDDKRVITAMAMQGSHWVPCLAFEKPLWKRGWRNTPTEPLDT